MSHMVFKAWLILAALRLTVIFRVLMIPTLIRNPDISAAFTAGFVNPSLPNISQRISLLVCVGCLGLICDF
jgi:hypothetical protein